MPSPYLSSELVVLKTGGSVHPLEITHIYIYIYIFSLSLSLSLSPCLDNALAYPTQICSSALSFVILRVSCRLFSQFLNSPPTFYFNHLNFLLWSSFLVHYTEFSFLLNKEWDKINRDSRKVTSFFQLNWYRGNFLLASFASAPVHFHRRNSRIFRGV
jgi:hypothetical protein